ncbi:MAG: HEAT repeat domain-containing protein, partial [Elusimicrobiaceae bacterium]
NLAEALLSKNKRSEGAAKAMGQIRDTAPVPRLIKALKHPRYQTRANAAWALGEIHDTRASEYILPLLKKDVSIDVRIEAAGALGKLKYEPAYKELVRGLANLNPKMREASARALGDLGLPQSLRVLEMAVEDSDKNVQAAAAEAYDKIAAEVEESGNADSVNDDAPQDPAAAPMPKLQINN